MSVVRLVKRSIVGVSAAVLLTVCTGATEALAAEPWWKLNVDTAPAVLQPGQAKDEVQEITVSATGGSFEVRTETPSFATHVFAWNVTHQEMQEGLEEMFGKGNVEVPSGQGNETGSEPYRVIFTGAFADRTVERMQLESSVTGGAKEATIKETTKGRSDATLILTAANMGGADLTGPVTIAAKLPSGLTALGITGTGGFLGFGGLECSSGSLSCSYSGTTFPYEQLQLIIPVNLKPGAKSGEISELVASGGNARAAKTARPITVGNAFPSFGVENYEMTPEEEGGAATTQAGSHPFQLTTTLMLNQRDLANPFRSQYEADPAGMGKDLGVKLPPGLIGNPTPFPQCRLPQFDKSENFMNECPDNTAIGVAAVTITLPGLFSFTTVTVPLFNLTPAVGEPARFGFEALGVPVYLDTSVRTGGDYGVTVKVTNITQQAVFVGSRVTFWGVPGDPRHDNARGWSCVADGTWQPFLPEKIPPCAPMGQHLPPPLLELPTSCTGPLQTTVEADSWEQAGSFVAASPNAPLPALDGCNALPFSPSISVSPDGQAGSTPTGLTVGIHVPQDVSLDAEGLGEADVKDTTVALPAGVALNPAAADGLLSCSEAQIALQAHAAPTCPEAAKVGSVEIKTPLLPDALTGAAYLAAQNANPFGSLVALYIVAEDPVSGTLIKIAGEVKPDPVTGQLVSTFKNTPQLPFEDFKIHFFGGARAPLTSPSLCGSYTTTASIAGWSGNPASEPSSEFQIVTGPNGSPCADPLPFAPSLTAGTTSIQAGGFSPFTMTMSRGDGNQNLNSVRLTMPPGLLGTLSTVKLCGEEQANLGTCGAESLIGHTIVSVGVGGTPYSVKGGEVFITGPYKGAPFGLSIVNPAKAGPFDLGKVVVRAKIEIDPTTAQLRITTDETGPYRIPTILDGIPLQIQHVNVSIDRPGFMFNPTSCNPLSISGSLTSSEGAAAALSVPFQVTNCAVLRFNPAFSASTHGNGSFAGKGASLSVKIASRSGAGVKIGEEEADIRRVDVRLPRALPSRLTTLQKACTSAQFAANPAGCPAASLVGTATARTPVLPVPLEGPVYFVSHGGAAFPDVVVVLQGDGVTVDLVGNTRIEKGYTYTKFEAAPDTPVSSFELNLPGGLHSALAANRNLCAPTRTVTVKKRVTRRVNGRVVHLVKRVRRHVVERLEMPTTMEGYNGVVVHKITDIAVKGCPKRSAGRATKRA